MEEERPKKIITQEQEYLSMGFKLMPSGRINHNLWYIRKFGRSSVKDSTWKYTHVKKWGGIGYKRGEHTCCKSKKAYCHRVGCKNRKELLTEDDYSDLKDL
jgi:hypothetical protein